MTARAPCHYCGLLADTVDHVIPQSILANIHNGGDTALTALVSDRRRRLVVPCCRECNGLAGAVLDRSLADRTARVRARLARRYRKALSMPDWSHAELAALGDGMHALIRAGLEERDTTRRRLAWKPTLPDRSHAPAQVGTHTSSLAPRVLQPVAALCQALALHFSGDFSRVGVGA